MPSRDVDTEMGYTPRRATLSPVGSRQQGGWGKLEKLPFPHRSVGGVGVGVGAQSWLRLCQGPVGAFLPKNKGPRAEAGLEVAF